MGLLFSGAKTKHFKSRLSSEAEIFRYGAADWLKSQRGAFSQFGGEARRAPDESLLHSIGYLIWACATYEVKLSRAVFWLECYKTDSIVALPGQSGKRSSKEGALNKLLQDTKVASVIGKDGVEFIRLVVNRVRKSLKYRDDIVHGYHLGDWIDDHTVFRAKGKIFNKHNTEFIQPTSLKTIRHGNKVLSSAAVFALIDELFDDAVNG